MKIAVDDIIVLKNLGDPINIKVRKSFRAKKVIIRIKGQGVELVIPKNVSKSKALDFLIQKETWIRSKLSNIPKANYSKENNIKLHSDIPILGVQHNITYINCKNKLYVEHNKGNIVVNAPEHLYFKLLSQHLKQYALEQIINSVKCIAENFDFKKYGKISVKEVTSKWGSCSSKGNLSFNWRIIFAPQSVFYYVISHEMSHLKEMNHGDKFWALVREIDPNYQLSIAWLKKYGVSLYQYLP